MPGSEKASQMTATSGLNILGLYERLNRPMLLARMLLASSRWTMAKHLTGYSLIWRVRGTRSNHLLFQLAVSGRGIEEIESGLLPTPVAQEGPGGQQMKLTDAVEIIEGREPKYYKMFPTPTARDHKDGKGTEWSLKNSKQHLGREVHHTEGIGGALNPQWVEWLMGFPEGWTDLKD